MKPVTQTENCYVSSIQYEGHFQRLVQSARDLCSTLMGDLWEQHVTKFKHFTINLNHPDGVTGMDRFFSLNGKHGDVKAAGYDESQFTVMPDLVADSPVGTFIKRQERDHEKVRGTPFRGRHQLIWVNPGGCYPIHNDAHTPHRYHVALWTNPRVYWMFERDQDFTLLHMPANGSVYYLNPTVDKHSVMNLGTTPRCHLLMTSSV